jgi:ribose transport system substrate-binding protein
VKSQGIHSKRKLSLFALSAILSVSLFGCSSQSASNQNGNGTGISQPVQPSWYQKPSEDQLNYAKQDNISGVILSRGPHGEKAFPAKQININNDQFDKIKAGHYTAAIAMHYTTDDWSQQQMAGLKSEFKRLGINVIAITDANFKDSQQISDLEAISAKKPNILVSAPVDAKTEANAYKQVADSGTKIVFMDQPADGMVAGKDYVSLISADNFGNGMVAADELAKALGNKGNVAAVYYSSNFYVTNQRYEGFYTRLKVKYPNIHVVAASGFADPTKAQSVSSALLTRYPNLQGMWVAWADPAMGAITAARTAGKSPKDFKIVTEDLSNDVALNIAQNSFTFGFGAQRPFDQGVAEADEAALSMIGEKTYPYVAVPSMAVDRSNLAKAYQTINHKNAPADIINALGQ